jgi:hypothetical protein
MGVRWPAGPLGTFTRNMPPLTVSVLLGAMTWTLLRRRTGIVMDLLHWHPGVFRQQLRQGALNIGRKMLDNCEGKPGVGWHVFEKSFELLQAARRSYCDDQALFQVVLLSLTIHALKASQSASAHPFGVQLLVSSFLDPFVA